MGVVGDITSRYTTTNTKATPKCETRGDVCLVFVCACCRAGGLGFGACGALVLVVSRVCLGCSFPAASSAATTALGRALRMTASCSGVCSGS